MSRIQMVQKKETNENEKSGAVETTTRKARKVKKKWKGTFFFTETLKCHLDPTLKTKIRQSSI